MQLFTRQVTHVGTVAVAVAVFVAFCLFMTGLDSGHRQQQIQDANEQQASTPDQLEANCSAFAGVELVRCIASQIEAQRQARHDAYDLVAQQQSATWATVAALAAVGGLVATIIGLFFVWQSLSKTNEALTLTRQANDHSRVSAEQQLRAYIVTQNLVVKQLEVGHRPVFEVEIINSGQTPARKLQMITGFVTVVDRYGKFRLRQPGQKGPVGSMADLGGGEDYRTPVYGTNPLDQASRDALKAGDVTIIVGAYGSYFDIFGKRHRFTAKGYLSFDHAGKPELIVSHNGNRGN